MKRHHRYIFGALVLLIIFSAVILLSQAFSNTSTMEQLVMNFGYLGVIMTGVIGGLNTMIPVPPAALTPLFVSLGLSFPLIVIMLTAGTLIADYVGFALGHVSRKMMELKHPRLFTFFLDLKERHHRFVIPMVFFYAAIMPIPNEIILIPLALSGMRFRFLLLPLLFGNLISQAVLSYGFTGLFDVLF